jgi:ATP-dependent Lon protease
MSDKKMQSQNEKDEKQKHNHSRHDVEVDLSRLPTELPLLPLNGGFIFPFAVVPLLVTEASAIQLIQDCFQADRLLGLVPQQDPQQKPEDARAEPEASFSHGSLGLIHKMIKMPDGQLKVLVQGQRRIKIDECVQREPYLRSRVTYLDDIVQPCKALDALQRNVTTQFMKLITVAGYLPDELQGLVMNTEEPGRLADLIAFTLSISFEEKRELFEMLNVQSRLEKLATIISREVELLELGNKLQTQVQESVDQHQKEFYLRQQLQAIQKELGEADSPQSEIDTLQEKIEAAQMPQEARLAADNELKRLRNIPPASPEHSMVRTYLEWLVDLPWSSVTDDNWDLLHARTVLDAEHYGLDKIKDRILEYLAVRKLRQDSRGPILCFVGPPGVGKTSLGRSIAEAMGRKLVRISLGGVRDEAEIRGHRRTYLGALPGRIIQALRTAGTNNPLFMLDEIDKLGADFHGDPASALLEVLDPEQNATFSDHYLGVAYDLSKVMFITTANALDPIPPALRDRMEVIQLAGYIEEDKLEIAKRHLIPKQIAENGLCDEHIAFTDDAVLHLGRGYTHEAGVRNLEREIGSVCRKVARAVTEGQTEKTEITPHKVVELLGPEKFEIERADQAQEPGVVTGLAWTPNGGDILNIESIRMPGKKGLTITGNLGEVMKESAQTALSLVRSRADQLGIEADFFEKSDLHIHVPAGAIPKDGPSAGITMTTALASLLTDRPVRPQLAMTGEISLRGKVMPIGGLKEKVLAAQRAGITRVILPKRNEKDLAEVPATVRAEMQFDCVETIDEVLDHALEPQSVPESVPVDVSAPALETPAVAI